MRPSSHLNSTDFSCAVKQRQSNVKSEYRKKASKLDAEYPQPGNATTFKSILNEHGKGGEVLGLVLSYFGEASSDVQRFVDLVATRLASKHLEYVRTPVSIAKGDANPAHLPRQGFTPLHEDLRGSSWIVCGATWIRRPAFAMGVASWTLKLSSTSSTRLRLEEAVLNGLSP
jgi:hypothetical protein